MISNVVLTKKGFIRVRRCVSDDFTTFLHLL